MIPVKVLKITYQPADKSYAVILKDPKGNNTLPIIIGSFEAQSIALAIEFIATPRPLTHDLICDVINSIDAKLKSVQILRLKDGVFYAQIEIQNDKSKISSIDARPSDAIALALRLEVPIMVSPKIFKDSSLLKGITKVENSFYRNDIEKLHLKDLEAKLKLAIDEEDYEIAAKLRDTISRLKL